MTRSIRAGQSVASKPTLHFTIAGEPISACARIWRDKKRVYPEAYAEWLESAIESLKRDWQDRPPLKGGYVIRCYIVSRSEAGQLARYLEAVVEALIGAGVVRDRSVKSLSAVGGHWDKAHPTNNPSRVQVTVYPCETEG